MNRCNNKYNNVMKKCNNAMIKYCDATLGLIMIEMPLLMPKSDKHSLSLRPDSWGNWGCNFSIYTKSEYL